MEEHDKTSEWEQSRPQNSRQRLYLILGILAIVIILGSMCLYLVPLFGAADGDNTSSLLLQNTALFLPAGIQ